jgi:hypothetical protein
MSCKKADCNGKPIPRGKYCEIHRTKQRVKKNTIPKAKVEAKNDADMSTFKDLYEFLQHNELQEWIKTPWQGKDKQESVLRLFAGLNLIRKIDNYKVCSGNFNTMTIAMINDIRNIFYNGEDLIMLKDTGNSSDLTCMHKDDEKHLLVTTSKNLNRTNINNLDIADIILNFQQYKNTGYTMKLCVCIREEKEFKLMLTRVRDTNANLLAYVEDAIVIDWNDLRQAHIDFKDIYHSISVADIKESKKPLLLKMHQKLGVKKTLALKNARKKKILWGHIQRSGKSYIIGGCIIEDSKNKASCNYLIITTAPNETITQQMAVFDCHQLSSFNVARIEGDTKRSINNKNIYICSKQFLQNKKIQWLKNINFDMRFVDESHNGGTTDLAQKTLALYSGNSFTVQITATYAKPVSEYDIPLENMILWDLEDIKLCKDINDEKAALLVQKHGNVMNDLINEYTYNLIKEEYSKYPELVILSDRLTDGLVTDIIRDTRNNYYGWSVDACFLLCQESKEIDGEVKIVKIAEFQNKEENLKMWWRIFGKRNSLNIPDDEYPDEKVFMKRIEKICKTPETFSRFGGSEPMIIMAFLPQSNINKITEATIKLLEEDKENKSSIIANYIVIGINTKITNDPKQTIEDARRRAKNERKKGVLVLSGRQCSLGVSIENCDIVLLLNNAKGFDMIYQMMFRCMTEGKNKTRGFVVDLNIHRVINTTLVRYAELFRPNDMIQDSIKYIQQERIINLNCDHWMSCFGNRQNSILALSNKVYSIYSSNAERVIGCLLDRLKYKEILLSKEDQKAFNRYFSIVTKSRTITVEKKEDIKNGIEGIEIKRDKKHEKDEVDEKDGVDEKDDEEVENRTDYATLLIHCIPLVCILTIHNTETSFIRMCCIVKEDEKILSILIDQIKSWWGDNVSVEAVNLLISTYIKYLHDDNKYGRIISGIKELFYNNVADTRQLSQLIDKYLIPQELEKKKNAEVSTPHALRQEMLDKIPVEFWTTPKKVFEPCSGKGGFVIDIVDRFMAGLSNLITDEKERYRIIVEECLYFSDINPTNIYICSLLLDPHTEYKLNFNEGNTLELDISAKWGITGFDAVIGNPPYQSPAKSDKKKSGGNNGNTLWQSFVKKALQEWINNCGFLSYVHPSMWRSPCGIRSKNTGMFTLMTHSNDMLYLEIHSSKDGIRLFDAGTRYDWYVIRKTNTNNSVTTIKDELGVIHLYCLKLKQWLANHSYVLIENILATERDIKCDVLYSRNNYGSDKKWISKVETNEYKHKVIDTINKKGIKIYYTNDNTKGFFGISKVIFSNINIFDPLVDKEGIYAITEHSLSIGCSIDECDLIKNALLSKNFQQLIKACYWSTFSFSWRVFAYFKKDFWRDFI